MKTKLTILIIFFSSLAYGQQFQPLSLIDWSPVNGMFPLTTDYLGFTGVQQYALFDTAVYNVIDTSRAYTWLKPEMEAGNTTTITAPNDATSLLFEWPTGNTRFNVNPYFLEFWNDGLNSQAQIYAQRIGVYDWNNFNGTFIYDDRFDITGSGGENVLIYADRLEAEDWTFAQMGNYYLNTDQDTTGTTGYFLGHDDNGQISLINTDSVINSVIDTAAAYTWMKPEIENNGGFTINSNNSYNFRNGAGTENTYYDASLIQMNAIPMSGNFLQITRSFLNLDNGSVGNIISNSEIQIVDNPNLNILTANTTEISVASAATGNGSYIYNTGRI